MSDLANRVCKKAQSSPLTEEGVDTIKRYIKAAAVRSGIANTAMENSSVTAALLSNQEKHDVLAMHGMNFPGKLDDILREMGAMVLINQTERNFVVPRNCYYCAPIMDDVTIVAPISPKIAFSLFPATAHPGFGNVAEDPKGAFVQAGSLEHGMSICALTFLVKRELWPIASQGIFQYPNCLGQNSANPLEAVWPRGFCFVCGRRGAAFF